MPSFRYGTQLGAARCTHQVEGLLVHLKAMLAIASGPWHLSVTFLKLFNCRLVSFLVFWGLGKEFWELMEAPYSSCRSLQSLVAKKVLFDSNSSPSVASLSFWVVWVRKRLKYIVFGDLRRTLYDQYYKLSRQTNYGLHYHANVGVSFVFLPSHRSKKKVTGIIHKTFRSIEGSMKSKRSFLRWQGTSTFVIHHDHGQ